MHLVIANGIKFISLAQLLQLKLSLLRAAEIGWSSKQSTKFTYCSSGNSPTYRGIKSSVPLRIFVQTHTVTPALPSSLSRVLWQ